MTRLWDDTTRIPATLTAALRSNRGIEAVAERLRDPSVRRVVITGNGAAWYAGMAVWLAALETPSLTLEMTCVPGGMVARGRFAWRSGDLLLAISSSGEFRDLVEATAAPNCPPVVAVTANPQSSIGRVAVASATVDLPDAAGFTHCSAYAANIAMGLAVLAAATGDPGLSRMVEGLPDLAAGALHAATNWNVADAIGAPQPRMVLAIGDGPAWAASLEMALLAREVARLPAEGAELREGATSSMFGVGPDDLAVIAEVGAPGSDAATLEDEAAAALREQGAHVVRLPGGQSGDRRLASILAFPASVRVAIHLAVAAGLNPDAPETTGAYYRTARIASAPGSEGTA
jgi:fructoselysine-6-P-deglycase FrlB-like protein